MIRIDYPLLFLPVEFENSFQKRNIYTPPHITDKEESPVNCLLVEDAEQTDRDKQTRAEFILEILML